MLGLHGLNRPAEESASELLESLLDRKTTEWEYSSGEPREVDRDLFTLNIATALFVQEAYPILASYRDTVMDHFRAELFSLDFRAAAVAAERINGWVSEQTQGKIPTLVSSDGLVLCSQSLFRFADLGDDGLCRGGPDKGCGVIVSAIDVVVDRLD